MRKKISEAGKTKIVGFLKSIADVCKKNGDHDLVTMDCLIEITAEIGEIAQRDDAPVLEVLKVSELERPKRAGSKHTLSAKGKAEAADLWKTVSEYFEKGSVSDLTFSNCVGAFITNVEDIAKDEELPVAYVLDCFAACMLDLQNGFA